MKLYRELSGDEYILKLESTVYAYRKLHPKQGIYSINMSWWNDSLHRYQLISEDKLSICKMIALSGVDLDIKDYW